mmetsp:Transcript_1598/g.4365  ORF Transcript_1598/g.4365 Transcript_1598/m.4365 type:complete len:163 (-) Transcript_1598:626-1114(-)
MACFSDIHLYPYVLRALSMFVIAGCLTMIGCVMRMIMRTVSMEGATLPLRHVVGRQQHGTTRDIDEAVHPASALDGVQPPHMAHNRQSMDVRVGQPHDAQPDNAQTEDPFLAVRNVINGGSETAHGQNEVERQLMSQMMNGIQARRTELQESEQRQHHRDDG